MLKRLGGKGRVCWSRVETLARKVRQLEKKISVAQWAGDEERADYLRDEVASLSQRGDTYRSFIVSPGRHIVNTSSKGGDGGGKRQRWRHTS